MYIPPLPGQEGPFRSGLGTIMEIAAAGDENVCLQFSAEFLYISAKWCLLDV